MHADHVLNYNYLVNHSVVLILPDHYNNYCLLTISYCYKMNNEHMIEMYNTQGNTEDTELMK